MAVNRSLEIEMRGETYSLIKVPEESSAVVKEEKEKLLGTINLQTLVDDLGRVGAFIRIAYNEVGTAGPKFTEHQIEIQRLGYGVTKLCDKSALTVAKFQKASHSILTDLQSTYEFLVDNLEDMAKVTMSAVSDLAGDMAKAALELNEEFVQEKKRVEEALEKTQLARGAEAHHIEEMRKNREKMELKKEEQQALMEEHRKAEQEAAARRRDLEQQEDRAIADLDFTRMQTIKKLCNAFTSNFGFEAFDTEEPEKKVQALKEASMRAYEREQELCQQRQATLSKMTEFACKIKDCETERNMAKVAEEALYEAIGALKELSTVMMQAAAFWKQMQNHCESLAKSKMTVLLKTAIEIQDEEGRQSVWTSDGFKRQAITFYASWVALYVVCRHYVEVIKVTQKDLYDYIKENPTYEESRQNIRDLASKFLKDLKRDQKALENKEFEAQKKIKALESTQV